MGIERAKFHPNGASCTWEWTRSSVCSACLLSIIYLVAHPLPTNVTQRKAAMYARNAAVPTSLTGHVVILVWKTNAPANQMNAIRLRAVMFARSVAALTYQVWYQRNMITFVYTDYFHNLFLMYHQWLVYVHLFFLFMYVIWFYLYLEFDFVCLPCSLITIFWLGFRRWG